MTLASQPAFQVHWSLVPPDDAGDLAPPACRLLALWPAPVNHDACFEAAGFTLFGDNDEEWDRAAEDLLGRAIEHLSRFGAPRLVSAPLRDDPPWYMQRFRTGRELPLLQQALWPMQEDSLPWFHARFGESGVALRTGGGHFLLWITLPDIGPEPSALVGKIAQSWEAHETRLRWPPLLPGSAHASSTNGAGDS